MYVTYSFFFFFNDTATTEIYTLSLHDALPIFDGERLVVQPPPRRLIVSCARGLSEYETAFTQVFKPGASARIAEDRKSTRLNSSHANISYAVFCLKKKRNKVY